MIQDHVWTSRETRLWMLWDNRKIWMGEHYIYLWRIMREKDKRARIFLIGNISENTIKTGSLIDSLPLDFSIEIHAGVCRNVREYIPENLRYRFDNCVVSRVWLSNHKPYDDSPVTVYVELLGDEVR